ncbi:hypothetical protein [Flavonifractor sp. HCP28S3_F3]|uniref:hypothetical protein n=1 Tax=Flavonifractor sp. HCP28S3_F3 TaxID=3438939 RepID=UPI003F8BCF3A
MKKRILVIVACLAVCVAFFGLAWPKIYLKIARPDVLCDMGAEALNEGRAEDARLYFQTAMDRDPTCAESYAGMASLSLAAWDIEGAISGYQTAIQHAQANPVRVDEDFIRSCYVSIASLYAAMGQMEQGQAVLTQGYEATGDPKLRDYTLFENRLILNGACLTDLSPLASGDWDHLESLMISYGYGIADYSPITALPNLEELRLADCGLTDLSFLEGSDGFCHMFFPENNITDLTGLRGADNLRELNLGYNLNLKSLDGLETLSELERLYIGYTSVTDLEPLRGCRNLRRLELTYLDIDDYSPIQDCPIEMLDVHRIPKEDVELLREMFPDAIIYAST